MKRTNIDSIKLGIFVLVGLVLLIFTLYTLGKNKNLFGSDIELKTQFRNVNGLLVGNRVRFSGIEVGNVRTITILNDTTIEVIMNVDRDMKKFMRTDAVAQLGTDGLIGNRLVSINPGGGNAPFIQGGELLSSREEINTQEMMTTLYKTNENIAEISQELIQTVKMVNTSSELNKLLNDGTLAANLSTSLRKLRETTESASLFARNAVETLKLASEGEGTLAAVLTDTSLANDLRFAISDIRKLESRADKLLCDLTEAVGSINRDIHEGNGLANTLLKDSLMAARLKITLENVERGTASFAEDMEALKSNFLFRRYFKKKEKESLKKQKKDSE
jgi:phospholipid/cholesterol/gamma-HCH transport system substrate-binding protein